MKIPKQLRLKIALILKVYKRNARTLDSSNVRALFSIHFHFIDASKYTYKDYKLLVLITLTQYI